MYVDEAGDTGTGQGSPSTHFALSGLVLHENHWLEVLDKLIAFRKDIRLRFGLKLREELHAARFMSRPGSLTRIPRHQRLQIIREFGDCLNNIPEIRVISVVVSKHGKQTPQDVFDMAWKALVQRFENTIARCNFPGSSSSSERGMLLPDFTDNKALISLTRAMRRYNPVPNQSSLPTGFRNLQISRLVEDPSFRDSRNSFFVQAADTLAFMLYQHYSTSSYLRKNGGRSFYGRLSNIHCKHASRKHPFGIVEL